MTKSTTWVTGASVLVAAELVHWTSRCARSEPCEGCANFVGEEPSQGSGHLLTPAALPDGDLATTDRSWRSAVSRLLALFGIAAVLSGPMFIRNVLTYGITDPLVMARHEIVVMGQPTTAEMIAQLGAQRVIQNFLAITFRSFWAQFGWMGVLVDERIYLALFALTAVGLLGLALYAYRVARDRAMLDDTTRGCLGVMALLVVTAIVDYLGYNGKFFQAQGRYLFPAIVPIALFLVLGLREILAKEHARFLFALLYVVMVGLDIAALFLYIVPQLRA